MPDRARDSKSEVSVFSLMRVIRWRFHEAESLLTPSQGALIADSKCEESNCRGKRTYSIDIRDVRCIEDYQDLMPSSNPRFHEIISEMKAFYDENSLRSLGRPAYNLTEDVDNLDAELVTHIPQAYSPLAPYDALGGPNSEGSQSSLCQLLTSKDLDIETFRKSYNALINAGADLSERMGDGNTVIHIALYKCLDVAIVDDLIQSGYVEVNMANACGWTPLHILMSQLRYTKEQSEAILLALLSAGADVSRQNDRGDTPLHLAIYYKQDVSTIEQLIKEGSMVDVRNKSGRNAIDILMMVHSCVEDSVWVNVVFRALCDRVAAIAKPDHNGDTLLHLAVRSGMDITIIRPLLDRYKINANTINNLQQTAFHVLLSSHIIETVCGEDIAKVLVEAGMDLSIKDAWGNPVLHLILLKLSGPTISSFLENGGVDMNVTNNNGDTALHVLLNHRIDLHLVETMLKYNADANIANADGLLPLHLAMYKDSTEAVELLMRVTHDLNSVTKSGLTALHCACENGATEYVRMLTEAGADANMYDKHGNTPLHMCIMIQEDEAVGALVEALIRGGAEPDMITRPMKEGENADGYSLLHLAVMKEDIVLTRTLIDLGASVNQRTRSGKLALHLAGERQHIEFPQDHHVGKSLGKGDLQLMKEEQFKKLSEMLLRLTDLDSVDECGRTPLHIAVNNKMYRLIPLLLEHHADANIFSKDGWLPLHQVKAKELDSNGEENDKLVAIKALIEKTADIDIENPINGWTALHCAADADDSQLIQILLENKATVDKPNKEGFTAVQLAARKCHIQSIEILIKMGADAGQRDDSGRSLLHLCVYGRHGNESSIVNTVGLLANYVYLNTPDAEGYTPLHHAIISRAVSAVRALLGESRDMNVAILTRNTPSGDTVVHLASAVDCSEMLQILVASGADMSKTDQKGQGALHTAAISGSVDAGRFLLEHSSPIASRDAESHTALQLSALHGHQEMTCLLLKQHQTIAHEELRDKGSEDSESDDPESEDEDDVNIDEVAETDSCITAIKETHNFLVDELRDSKVHPSKRETIIGNWYRSLIRSNVHFDLLKHVRHHAPDKPKDAGFVFAPVVPVEPSAAEHILKNEGIYEMGHSPRGRAVILCNIEFDQQAKRTGGQKDVDKLKCALTQLSFEVDTDWQNLTAEEIHKRIKVEQKNEIHKKSDVFVMALMSHGCTHDYIYGTDGEGLHIHRDIIDKFNQVSCPALQGKPKIFIVQACRSEGCKRNHPVEKSNDATVGSRSPNKSDTIIIYSTYPGSPAVRDKRYGSWLIEELVLMLELFAHEDHLEEITRKARRLLKFRQRYSDGAFQLSELSSNTDAKLYFLPGYTSRENT